MEDANNQRGKSLAQSNAGRQQQPDFYSLMGSFYSHDLPAFLSFPATSSLSKSWDIVSHFTENKTETLK